MWIETDYASHEIISFKMFYNHFSHSQQHSNVQGETTLCQKAWWEIKVLCTK